MRGLVVSKDSDIGFEIYSLHRELGDDVVATSRNGGGFIRLELNEPGRWPRFDDCFDRIYYCLGIGGDRASRAEVMNVNAFLTLDCVRYLTRFLVPGGKLVVLSSAWGSIGSSTGSRAMAYRMSKAALNMGLSILASEYTQFHWCVMHPGVVQTKMLKVPIAGIPAMTAKASAVGVVRAASNFTLQFGFINYRGEKVGW